MKFILILNYLIAQVLSFGPDVQSDFLTFVQDWPIADCIEYLHYDPTVQCSIKSFQNWTIHGIGVTTQNGEVKSYCNSSVEYDPKLIHPLIEQLTLAWTNDHANSPIKNKLWKFEWLKHGSCGLDIGAIDNEFKYFSKALEWHGRYPFFRYLQQSGILPGFDHQIQDIIKALNTGLGGKSPALTCRKYSDFTNPILSQIKLCFDKSMTLVDCYSVMPWNKVLDSCPNEGLVFYPRYEHNNKKVENAGVIIGLVIGLCVLSWSAFMITKRLGQLRILLNPWSVIGSAPDTPLLPGTENDPLLNTIPEVVETVKIDASFLSIVGTFTPKTSPYQSISDLTVYGTPTSTFSIETMFSANTSIYSSTQTLK